MRDDAPADASDGVGSGFEDRQLGLRALGEFGVLAGHTPFLTSLNVGSVHFKDTKGADRYIFVSGGFAEALPNKVTMKSTSPRLKVVPSPR